MGKRFQVEMVEDKVRVTCELLEQQAPQTTKALWPLLQEGYEVVGEHGTWTGLELIAYVPPDARDGIDASRIPVENATMYPARGDVTWLFFPAGKYQFMKKETWMVSFVFGNDVRYYFPAGLMQANVWAKIVEGLEEFAQAARPAIQGDRKTLRIKALTR